ncbi:MAG: hypothetical protein HC844_00955 [Tabrizicola sp.]|nr:hypothetical protein [Tabrizicola sp.]
MVAEGGVTVRLADGTIKQRAVRNDRHTLMTAIASHPYLTAQVMQVASANSDCQAWVRLNVAFFRALYGERLVSVVQHLDEEHPHLHAFILPSGDRNCSARDLNPAWTAKVEAEAAAKSQGLDAKAAVKLGNAAYKDRARALQDQYYHEVSLAAGLTRDGPKRQCQSRAQWQARKAEAERTARVLQEMEARVVELAEQEEALEASVEDLADRLDQAETLFADAEAEKALAAQERARVGVLAQAVEREAAAQRSAAEEEAQKIRLKGQQDAALILTEARTNAARLTDELKQVRQAFEGQKATIARHAAAQAASVAVQVVLGVLTGKVTRRPDGAGWEVHDNALRQKVEALDLGPVLGEVVARVAALWERLVGRLTTKEVTTERDKAEAALSPSKASPIDRGMTP